MSLLVWSASNRLSPGPGLPGCSQLECQAVTCRLLSARHVNYEVQDCMILCLCLPLLPDSCLHNSLTGCLQNAQLRTKFWLVVVQLFSEGCGCACRSCYSTVSSNSSAGWHWQAAVAGATRAMPSGRHTAHATSPFNAWAGWHSPLAPCQRHCCLTVMGCVLQCCSLGGVAFEPVARGPAC